MKINENSSNVPTRTFQAPASRGELSQRAADYVHQLQVAEAHRATVVECDACFADSPKGSATCLVCGAAV